MSLTRLFIIGASLAAGNFFYQALAGEQWGVATERTFFEANALFLVWLLSPKSEVQK